MIDASRAGARPETARFRLGYQGAFDGMRAAAVLCLLVYHTLIAHSRDPGVVRGAYLWVEMFFVQSGFLITSLLLEERAATGNIALRSFYWRRALRLVPALALAAGAVSVYLLTVSEHEGDPNAWREVWTTLLYVINWFAAFSATYFPYYLSHAWSLAIEWQFYLVAPLLVLVAMRARLSARGLAVACTAAALGTTALMVGLSFSQPQHRLYMGTDTRAGALLIGMALAAAAHAGLLQRVDRRALVGAGTAGAIVFVTMVATVSSRNVALYRGLFLLCDVAVAAVLVEIVRSPRALVPRALSVRPLQAIGRMAYGVYLWHWPVVLVIAEKTDLGWVPALFVGTLVTFVIATLSYRLVERPLIERFSSGRHRRHTREPGGTAAATVAFAGD
jgi:peptidoglycan/LPS O-acetylase OafA/YrhL